jgi:predicted transcriptional regulator
MKFLFRIVNKIIQRLLEINIVDRVKISEIELKAL